MLLRAVSYRPCAKVAITQIRRFAVKIKLSGSRARILPGGSARLAATPRSAPSSAAKATATAAAQTTQTPATPSSPPVLKMALRYPLRRLPKSDKPTGYLAPLGGTEGLPFQFQRTPNNNLPVYSDLKKAGTKHLTIVRKFSGDVKELKEELSRLLSDQKEVEIVEHAGSLHIKGNHVLRVKRWMRQLGF